MARVSPALGGRRARALESPGAVDAFEADRFGPVGAGTRQHRRAAMAAAGARVIVRSDRVRCSSFVMPGARRASSSPPQPIGESVAGMVER
jgi:hypothetical protein